MYCATWGYINPKQQNAPKSLAGKEGPQTQAKQFQILYKSSYFINFVDYGVEFSKKLFIVKLILVSIAAISL